jgi:hypothetical protein
MHGQTTLKSLSVSAYTKHKYSKVSGLETLTEICRSDLIWSHKTKPKSQMRRSCKFIDDHARANRRIRRPIRCNCQRTLFWIGKHFAEYAAEQRKTSEPMPASTELQRWLVRTGWSEAFSTGRNCAISNAISCAVARGNHRQQPYLNLIERFRHSAMWRCVLECVVPKFRRENTRIFYGSAVKGEYVSLINYKPVLNKLHVTA